MASLPPPKRVKPTMADLKHASEHDVVEHLNSVTCNRCGQRAPRRAALLKRWLKTQCHCGAAGHLARWNPAHCSCAWPRTFTTPDNPPVAQLHLLPWPRHLDLPHVWVLRKRCFQTAGPAVYGGSESSWKGQPIPCKPRVDARLFQGSS